VKPPCPTLCKLICVALLLFCGSSLLPPPAAATCAGDCDGSGSITVDEILRGVNIALGVLPLGDCPAFDADGSGAVEVDELIASVNFALAGCPVVSIPTPTPVPTPTAGPALTPIFAASYRNNFVEVRSCRFSIEHGGVAMRVLANPIGAAAYLAEANPLPVGSIVIKEEYNNADCSDDAKLVRWAAMLKRSPGFDAEHGDWHWQWVNRNRTVAADGKASCIACHIHSACVERDYMCTVDDGTPTLEPLRPVFDGLDPALLAVAGTSPTNVFVVGADPGDGLGPYVLHYNGSCWKRLETGAEGALWWLTFKPIEDTFFMVGEDGLILSYDLASRTFTRYETPGQPVLFGVWGDALDDIWAVGGDVGDENGGGVIWHYDGSAWSAVDLSAVLPAGVPTLFKIWGRNANDVYVVGRSGTILHFNGSAWAAVASDTVRPLFTVHGNDDLVVATGGFIDGVLVENDGSGFVDRTPRGVAQLNGVFVPDEGTATAIGNGSAVALRGADGWSIGDSRLGTPRDFHAVWIDPQGGVWGVGGDLTVRLSAGVLVYGGQQILPTEIRSADASGCGDG